VSPAHDRVSASAGGRVLASAAADWYAANARDLPWRSAGVTPWGVLVSEVMLQQTPVARVLPAWRDWIARWPTPAALAADPPGDAIRAWGRLGYPRRALRLHECAAVMVARFGGTVPSDLDELLALPGIGGYTARAVAAFAYRQRHPVVDTNVRRVVARALTGASDAGPTTTARDLALVESLLPEQPERAALVSVAFMELGALVCVARNPRCGECPLATTCALHRSTTPTDPAGQPGLTTPARRAQRYAGTDRQVRGLLLAVLRDSTDPVPLVRLDAVWPATEQRRRALAGLVVDGLVHDLGHDRFALPG
jgi:A/G-specific adenine glycosylase